MTGTVAELLSSGSEPRRSRRRRWAALALVAGLVVAGAAGPVARAASRHVDRASLAALDRSWSTRSAYDDALTQRFDALDRSAGEADAELVADAVSRLQREVARRLRALEAGLDPRSRRGRLGALHGAMEAALRSEATTFEVSAGIHQRIDPIVLIAAGASQRVEALLVASRRRLHVGRVAAPPVRLLP